MDPLDEYSEALASRFSSVEQVKDMMIGSKDCSNHESFTHDLHTSMLDFLRFTIFDELFYAEDFQMNVELRKQVQELFTTMLSGWQGSLTL